MHPVRRRLILSLALGALPALAAPGTRPEPSHVRGTFKVRVVPLAPVEGVDDPAVGRFALDKRYRGEMEADGRGQMLTSGTGAPGSSGGYVAMERVTGSLRGLAGAFTLQHTGTLVNGTPQMVITVVPGSGTGDLAGIAGTLVITFTPGGHDFDFAYTLPSRE